MPSGPAYNRGILQTFILESRQNAGKGKQFHKKNTFPDLSSVKRVKTLNEAQSASPRAKCYECERCGILLLRVERKFNDFSLLRNKWARLFIGHLHFTRCKCIRNCTFHWNKVKLKFFSFQLVLRRTAARLISLMVIGNPCDDNCFIVYQHYDFECDNFLLSNAAIDPGLLWQQFQH